MSADLDRRVTEWALWFHQNKDRIPGENLKKRCDFQALAIDGLIECLAIATKDIQVLERRQPIKNIWLPSGPNGEFMPRRVA